MSGESPAKNLDHQIGHAKNTREYAYRILEGEHKNDFQRKDYIAFALFNRCLQTHEAAEKLVKHSLLDDAWVLARTLVEHAVNCAYMLYVADAKTADDFADYPDYKRYLELQDLKATNDKLAQQIVPAGQEEKLRARYEPIRGRFDGRRGDRWSPDERLYKRAARVDEKISEAQEEGRTDFLWLVNSVWRYGSARVHGSADVLAEHVTETENGIKIQRKYTKGEAAQVLYSANFALFLVLLLVDLRLGGRNAEEIKRRFADWGRTEQG